jgi:hypothetical protein
MTNKDVSQTRPHTLQGLTLDRRTLLRTAGFAALATTTFAVPGRPASASAACEALVHQDGFASPGAGNWTRRIFDANSAAVAPGDLWGNQTLFPPARYAIVPDPAGSGQPVMRFTVPADQTSYRAELARKQFPFGRYRYGVSHYIPTDYVPFRYGTILAQWHGYTLPDGRATNPPLALVLNGAPTPTWEFHMYRLQPDLTTQLTRHTLPVPVGYGRWNDWKIDITWSSASVPGRVVVTHGGSTVLDISGVNNYHQQWTPYFQTGIYRSSWRNGGYPAQPDLQIYHRGITVHDLTDCVS